MELAEFKKEALRLGYKKLRRDHPDAKVEPINTWNGFSPYLRGGGPTAFAMVEYFIEGDKLRVHKAIEGDFLYALSKDS